MPHLWNIRAYYRRSWYRGTDDRREDGRNIQAFLADLSSCSNQLCYPPGWYPLAGGHNDLHNPNFSAKSYKNLNRRIMKYTTRPSINHIRVRFKRCWEEFCATKMFHQSFRAREIETNIHHGCKYFVLLTIFNFTWKWMFTKRYYLHSFLRKYRTCLMSIEDIAQRNGAEKHKNLELKHQKGHKKQRQ